MSAKSKIKGKAFEREVANYLSTLYDASFQRVFDSGAFTGGANQSRRATLSEGQIRNRKGDIIPPDDWKYFNCECKSYSDFPFHQLFMESYKIKLLEEWIDQTRDAADDNDCNIILMKFNRRGRYLLVEDDGSFIFEKALNYKDSKNITWVFCEFEQFFKLNSVEFKNRCTYGIATKYPKGNR